MVRYKSIKAVLSIVCIMLGLASCGASKDSIELMANEPYKEMRFGNDLTKIEERVHQLVNDYRTRKNLPPFIWNESIGSIARNHSVNMAEGEVLWGHTGYEERVLAASSLWEWEEIGENLAKNNHSDPALASFDSWLESPMHLDNLLGDFNLTGIGVALGRDGEFYITQIFLRA